MDRQFYNDRGVIARWRQFLPVTAATPVVSLNEGSTPLIHSPRLSALVGRDCRVFIKFEGLNPTGSFKDRGMTMAISKAVEAGARAVICASTGNTSASAAAYAARAGIKCFVLLPAGKIAMGKLVQGIVHGAKAITIDGNFDDALRLVRDAADSGAPVAVVNSINSYRLEGQKTAAFEIIEDLGDAPDAHFLPVGNAGNISAYWKGLRRVSRAGPLDAAAAHDRLPGGRGRAVVPTGGSSSSRKRSLAPSASATRRAGNWRRRHSKIPAARWTS